jgi:hypothetical protein
LKHLHDEHEHYEHVIILNRLKNKTYWSTWTQNVIAWCKSCSTCWFNVNKHLTTQIRHILTFESMSIIKLNFLKFVKFSYIVTNCRYVLLRVNYFNRFIWAKFYIRCNMIKSTNMMNNLIASIFEWFRILY